jgi:predicted enzyme related to lactoylglutathione lyase
MISNLGVHPLHLHYWLNLDVRRAVMPTNEKLNYVELPASDLEATKQFFREVFQWEFVDYGPDYSAFSDQGLDGGFFRAKLSSNSQNGAALLIFFSHDLEKTMNKVELNGGKISKPIFHFPGGRRFHFCEPSGNEFAVWSKVSG